MAKDLTECKGHGPCQYARTETVHGGEVTLCLLAECPFDSKEEATESVSWARVFKIVSGWDE